MSVFAATVAFPSTPFPPKDAVDLRLAATGAAVDKGLPITGINDGFAGTAPDLGAYEVGQALPVYGPRGNAGTGGTGGSTGTTPAGGTTGSTIPVGGAGGSARPGGTTTLVAGAGGTATAVVGGKTGTRPGGSISTTVPPTGGVIAPVGGTATIAPLAGTTAILPTGGVVATGGVEVTDSAVPDAGVSVPVAKSGNSGCSCSLAATPSRPLASALVITMLLLRRRRARKSG